MTRETSKISVALVTLLMYNDILKVRDWKALKHAFILFGHKVNSKGIEHDWYR